MASHGTRKSRELGSIPSRAFSTFIAWRGWARGKPRDLINHCVSQALAGSTPALSAPHKLV